MEKIAKLKIVDVVQETNDAVSIHFKQPFFKKVKYTPGQFLTLLVDIEGKTERRCYSLNSAPNVDRTMSVTVKRVKDGKVSNYLLDYVKTGASMKVVYPMGNFTIQPTPTERRHVVLFGAGSGITPLMSMLKTVLHTESQSIVSLFYANRNEQSIIFNKELNQLQAKFGDRLTVVHILKEPGNVEACYSGRIDRSRIGDLLKEVPRFEKEKTAYYICGPAGMMEEVEEGLKAQGVEDQSIHIERFSAPPSSAQDEAADSMLFQDREVKIVLKGKEHTISVKANRTILDAALDHKINLPYTCMDGICGSCQATCKLGDVTMRNGHILSKKDLEAKQILPCICKPLTDGVEVHYE